MNIIKKDLIVSILFSEKEIIANRTIDQNNINSFSGFTNWKNESENPGTKTIKRKMVLK